MLGKVQRKLTNLIGVSANREILIVALSGGADSVCLLLILKELEKKMGFDLEAIHVEHGIRGQESRNDAIFVEKLCRELSVPCVVKHVDVPSYSKEKGIGTEEAARILRYETFSDYAKQRNGKIVLAHHMEDNAETILFQMLRGSSLNGMCGIRSSRQDEANVTYLRPLLDIRRCEIEAYLQSKGQEYCTDSTNQETEYRRNYLRKEILPRLSEINVQAVPHISKTAGQLEEIFEFLQSEAKKAMDALCQREADKLVLDCMQLEKYHPALQKEVIYEAIAEISGGKKDITFTHVEDVLSLLRLQSGKRVVLPHKVAARREFDAICIFIENREWDENPYIYISDKELQDVAKNGTVMQIPLPGGREVIELRRTFYDGNFAKIPKKEYTKWLDYDKIKNGFCIRKRENGDFFINDINGHRKKLKSYFIDEKITLDKRNNLWLLAQDSLVLWIVGGRISEHVKVTEETKSIIEFQYIGGN